MNKGRVNAEITNKGSRKEERRLEKGGRIGKKRLLEGDRIERYQERNGEERRTGRREG